MRSFSRMIWVSVTDVRSSPEAASTTEISRLRDHLLDLLEGDVPALLVS
jgi:hypothetical protein